MARSGSGSGPLDNSGTRTAELAGVLAAARAAAKAEQGESGHVLGDFRLLRILGRGGMGTVWEAEQISLGRKVALKVLAPQLSLSEDTVDRFRREASAGGRLRHPGIVAIYEVGEEQDSHFIAQELVPGGFSLADFLKELHERGETPEGYYRGMAALFAKVADALGAAHEAGIVHRDIKPGNILLAENEEPKVADFGLAKVNDDLVLSRTGELAGTPYYMSPEQASSRRDLDHRTDVFSLGATLYEALTLVRPFEGDTSQQVLEKILVEDPPDPRRLRSKVPWDLAVICLKAMEKRPEQRYQSMAEFAADLGRFLSDEPIVARPPGAVTRVMKWTRRHPVMSVSGSVAALAFVAVGLLVLHLQDKNAELARTQQQLVQAQQEKDELLKNRVADERAKWSSMFREIMASGERPPVPLASLGLGDVRPAELGLDEEQWRELNRTLAQARAAGHKSRGAKVLLRGGARPPQSAAGEAEQAFEHELTFETLEDVTFFELPEATAVAVIETQITGPLDELLGRGDVEVHALLTEADELYTAGEKAVAVRMYAQLRDDFPYTVVFQMNQERIHERLQRERDLLAPRRRPAVPRPLQDLELDDGQLSVAPAVTPTAPVQAEAPAEPESPTAEAGSDAQDGSDPEPDGQD